MPFVSYGLLQNIKRSQKRKVSQGPLLENTRLGLMDMFVWVNEWQILVYFFHKYIYNNMLLIATCRKLRPVLHLDPFSCFIGSIRDQTLNSLMPCVVR
jgi:hypothetical protein